ncbi:MAG: VanW family protein, partial [Clostridia bacterium]|nr:VanW family protein [Clostridia bacterium]
EANIIVDGQFVKGVGGGVCQVSSTLYNALLLANIKPIEVHKHSLPVSYVKPGLDAMVSWNTADLKFKNTTDYPIFITSNCNGSNLTFNIYGNTKQDSFYLKTESKIIKTIPHRGDKIEPDTRGKYLDRIMYKGEYARERAPRDGYIAHVYLNTYQNGVLIKQDLIREVMYEPQLGLVYEGTKDPPENNKV